MIETEKPFEKYRLDGTNIFFIQEKKSSNNFLVFLTDIVQNSD